MSYGLAQSDTIKRRPLFLKIFIFDCYEFLL
jgi:hypothetical protein